jgi:hypothetical protein
VLASVLISEITTAGSGRQLERVADKSTTEAINVEGLVPDRAKWIAAVLHYVGLRRQVRVSGLAFRANDHEVVISVTITKPNRVVSDSRTFTNADPNKEPEVLIRELVHDAAAWTLFRLNFLVRRYGIGGFVARLRRTEVADAYCLGTHDWRSWGRFRRAVWRNTQKLPDARDAYLEAVEYDPKNWGAWLNLGSLDTRTNPPRSVTRLRIARVLIESKTKAKDQDPHDLEPAYYRLLYLLGIAHLNCSIHSGVAADERKAAATQAQVVGTDLVKAVATTQLRLSNWRTDRLRLPKNWIKRAKRRDLLQTMALVQTTGIALLASAKVNAGKPIDITLRDLDLVMEESVQHDTQQSLAELGLDASPDLLVGDIGRLCAPQQLSAGTHYNLACVYARALRPHGSPYSGRKESELIDTALWHLVSATESGDRGALAEADAAFNELRARAPGPFQRITRSHRAPAAASKPEPAPATASTGPKANGAATTADAIAR